MTFCYNCFKNLDTLRKPCPHCGAPALQKDRSAELEITPDVIRTLEKAPEEEVNGFVTEVEVERLLKRGRECFHQGKAWNATKNRPKARKDFQRALKYFENVLKMDSTNDEAREFRSKCLQKMA